LTILKHPSRKVKSLDAALGKQKKEEQKKERKRKRSKPPQPIKKGNQGP